MTVLVTGATGAIGPCVVWTLHEAGYRIRILVRNIPTAGLLPDGIDVHIGDITDRDVVESAVPGCETVMHLAALLHMVNPPATSGEMYERINVTGTSTVVEVAAGAGVKRVVLFSTIAVYGHATARVLTEDDTPQPDTIYAKSKLAAERIVLGVEHPNNGPLGTVLRLAAVYGPRVKGNYRRLLRSLAHGSFIPIGNGRNRRTVVYEKDVAQAALSAMRHPAASGQVFNVSDGQFHTLKEVIATMCEVMNRTPPRLSLPVRPVRLAAGILEDTARLFGGTSPIGRAMVDKYTEDLAVSSQRIQTQLGFVPRYDLKKGWRETFQEMQRTGIL